MSLTKEGHIEGCMKKQNKVARISYRAFGNKNNLKVHPILLFSGENSSHSQSASL